MSILVSIILILLFFLHIIAIFINIGAMNSYLQNSHIAESSTLKAEHFTISIFVGIFGILTFPYIMERTDFPKFGLRYWKLAFGESNHDWHERYEEAVEAKFLNIVKSRNKKGKDLISAITAGITINGRLDAGRYIDIWEDYEY